MDNPNPPASRIQLMCPNFKCRRILAVPAAARGKNVRCVGCGTFVRVPPGPAQRDAAKM